MQGRKATHKNRLALCALALGLAFNAAPSRAADPVNVGILDEVKLGEGYLKYRNAMAELTARAETLEKQLRARDILNVTEGKRFDDLIGKTTLTPGETTEFTNIIAAGLERQKKYIDYTAKVPRSADEDKFIKEAVAYKKANEVAINRLEDGMFQDLKKRESETDQEYIKIANQEVQKVAADRKLSFVLRKDAVAWFSPAVDITEEVLKRLNRQ